MTGARIMIAGESYITLEIVAECYECEYLWVKEAYDLGLLGAGELSEGQTAVRVTTLDRVAELIRLCRYHGVALEVAAGIIESEDA